MKTGRVYAFKRHGYRKIDEALYVALTSWGDEGKRHGRRATARVLILWSNTSWNKPGKVLEVRQNDELWRLSKELA